MLEEHRSYVADAARIERFRSAVARVVMRGSLVADLGCGTGILGLLCLEAGAARVYAIDSTSMLDVARQTLTGAGYGDRTVFIRGHSRRITLPERVDLVICDHVGFFGFDYGIVHTLQDARMRFLKPDGRLIPTRIRLMIGAVESPECRIKVDGWRSPKVPPEFHWLQARSVNAKHPVELGRETLLGAPAVIGEIDLHADNPEFFRWSAELRATRDGMLHGLGGWFDCELAPDVWMTNSPLVDARIDRSQVFLPIEEGVPLRAGDSVKVTIMARPADDLLAWVVDVPSAGRRVSHSTWQGSELTPEALASSRVDRIPHLSREGRARMTVLRYCDGKRTASEIEQCVQREHPDLFPSAKEIAHFVALVLARDTD